MSVFFVGDSKTCDSAHCSPSNTWPTDLLQALNDAGAGGISWSGHDVGLGATTAVSWAASIDSVLSGGMSSVCNADCIATNHAITVLSLGVNDFGSTDEATFKSDMLYVMDAIHTKWAATVVYVNKPWRSGQDATSDTFAGWIDYVVGQRSFARAGDDERSWWKPNCTSIPCAMSTDGLHFYPAAGQAAKRDAVRTALGY